MTRPSPRSRRFASAVAALAIGALVAAGCSDDGDDDVARLGDDQPGISVDTVQVDADPDTDLDVDYATFDGGTANLTDYEGEPVVLNFFAAWCASCVSEMPDFDEVAQARDDVRIVGMSQDVREEDATELIAETEITYDTGWDPEGDLFARFGAFAMPTTVFITAEGQVAEVFSGALDAEALDEMIDEHLT